MSVARFILAALAGALLCYWALFLFVAGSTTGEIFLDGYVAGYFAPGYLASLYLPPIVAAFFSYFALRKKKTRHA